MQAGELGKLGVDCQIGKVGIIFCHCISLIKVVRKILGVKTAKKWLKNENKRIFKNKKKRKITDSGKILIPGIMPLLSCWILHI